ncbi:MAG: hypothetical protein QHJ82_06610 [Verrucomicrobiota bacterium]|nr:hypothetical protein [Verrucomicrobiota bacterium]
MKTTMELPDTIFRQTKALAARKGIPLRQVVVEALAQYLKADKETAGDKPWLRAFQNVKKDQGLARELRELERRIVESCEQVNPEGWE